MAVLHLFSGHACCHDNQPSTPQLMPDHTVLTPGPSTTSSVFALICLAATVTECHFHRLHYHTADPKALDKTHLSTLPSSVFAEVLGSTANSTTVDYGKGKTYRPASAMPGSEGMVSSRTYRHGSELTWLRLIRYAGQLYRDTTSLAVTPSSAVQCFQHQFTMCAMGKLQSLHAFLNASFDQYKRLCCVETSTEKVIKASSALSFEQPSKHERIRENKSATKAVTPREKETRTSSSRGSPRMSQKKASAKKDSVSLHIVWWRPSLRPFVNLKNTSKLGLWQILERLGNSQRLDDVSRDDCVVLLYAACPPSLADKPISKELAKRVSVGCRLVSRESVSTIHDQLVELGNPLTSYDITGKTMDKKGSMSSAKVSPG